MTKLVAVFSLLTVVSTSWLAWWHRSHYFALVDPQEEKFRTPLALTDKHAAGLVTGAETSPFCTENPSGEWTVTDLNSADGYPTYDSDLSQFLQGPAFRKDPNELKYAVCQIRTTYYWTHFPHTMQQLYRCWSYWLANHDKPPILIWRKHRKTRLNTFLSGFVEMLEQGIGLKVVWRNSREYLDYNETYVEAKNTTKWAENDIEITDFALVDPTRQLNRVFESQAASLHAAGCGNASFPTIAILNRHPESKRHLLYANELAERLQTAIPELTKIRIDTFEQKTFLEQAQFMAESDIVLTPHGAHLTSLPFLPQCASVLEFFPKEYLVADYFGSLAKSTSVAHSFIYLDHNETMPIPQHERYHFVRSHEYKSDPLCPPQSTVVVAVHQMVQTWRQCCRDKRKQLPSPEVKFAKHPKERNVAPKT